MPNDRSPAPDFKWSVWHEATILDPAVEPDEITAILGIEPTVVRRASDPILPTTLKRRRAAGIPDDQRPCWWSLETPERHFDTAGMNRDGDRDLDALVEDFYGRMAAIRSLCPPASLQFLTVIYTDSCCPAVGLSLETSRRVVELGATWGATIWFGNDFGEDAED